MITADDQPLNPLRVSIIGFGLMGAQISQVFAQADYDVIAFDVDQNRLDQGLNLIKTGKYGLHESVRKNRLTQEGSDDIFSRIKTTNLLKAALSGSKFVLEAAVEDLRAKQDIFKQASQEAESDAVLATNTSTLSIAKIGQGLPERARRRLAGMHFFNPPQVMKLVEIVRTAETSDNVVAELSTVARNLGKTPVTVLDYPGFVANRIGISVFAEASDLVARGVANIRDIDLCMKLGYGYPMGPFELGDLVGLDARLRNMEALYSETQDEKFRPPELLKKLVSEGYLGNPRVKPGSKGGYYEYFGLERPGT